MQVNAALLWSLPVRGNALVDVRLVDDLGYQLLAVATSARVGGRKLAAHDSIFTASRNQQTEQCPYAVYSKAEYYNGDKNEYGDASPHGDGCCCSETSFFLLFSVSGGVKSRAHDRDVGVRALGVKHS